MKGSYVVLLPLLLLAPDVRGQQGSDANSYGHQQAL
jgi:hypothetical protein